MTGGGFFSLSVWRLPGASKKAGATQLQSAPERGYEMIGEIVCEKTIC